MLSSKVFNITCLLKNNIISCPLQVKFLSTSPQILQFTNNDGEPGEGQIKERKLKEWREPLARKNKTESNENKTRSYDPDKGYFRAFRAKFPLTPWEMKDFLKKKTLDNQRESQKLNELSCKILGYDLALAYFIIMQGGKLKFKGHNEWLSNAQGKAENILPNEFDSNYIVEEVDFSDILLFYEGLAYFNNVKRIKRIIFKNSPLFDDWFMDKISAAFPRLEYLDVSNCPSLTERGLEGLYRAGNLKKLIITNYRKTAAFELTCMMLEDCLPNLQIEILDPPEKKTEINET